jgi:hypothetical protein
MTGRSLLDFILHQNACTTPPQRTFWGFVRDELNLWTIWLECFSPELMLKNKPIDPLVYQMFGVFFLIGIVSFGCLADFLASEERRTGGDDMLAYLAKLPPHYRDRAIIRLCKKRDLSVVPRVAETHQSEEEEDSYDSGFEGEA